MRPFPPSSATPRAKLLPCLSTLSTYPLPCQPGLCKTLRREIALPPPPVLMHITAAGGTQDNAQHSCPDDWDFAVEDPGELGLHNGLALRDALLALCEALELDEQALNILLRLLGL